MLKYIFFILLVPSVCFSQNSILYNGMREITNIEAYELLKPYGKAYLAFGAQKITSIGDEAFIFDYGDEIIAVGVGKKSKRHVDEEEGFTEEQEEEIEQKIETNREVYLREAKEKLDEEYYMSAAEYYHYAGDNASALAILTEHEQEIIENSIYPPMATYNLGFAFWEYGNKERGAELLRIYTLKEEKEGRYNNAASVYGRIGDTENANRCREIYLNSEY